jgi:hypothetical protein
MQMKFERIATIHDATQWFKNGDHPLDYASDTQGMDSGELRTFTGAHRKKMGWEGEIVRYFRDPNIDSNAHCPHCYKTMHEHGWIDGARNGGAECTVCPGDWIVTGVNGEFYPCKDSIFRKIFRPIP